MGFAGTIIIFLGSLLYKQSNVMVCHHFPLPASLIEKGSQNVPFYVFFFFSKNNCSSCLKENFEVLSNLPSNFKIAGVLPAQEYGGREEIKNNIKVSFPLYSSHNFRKYLPLHWPSLYGVSPAGEIIFVVPIIQGQSACLETILFSVYGEMYPSFKKAYFALETK